MKYNDAQLAIDWLCQTWQFERHLVVNGPGDSVKHAQLKLGNAMIMLGSVDESDYGKRIVQPSQLDGKETQSPYIVVDDPDWFYQRAKESGAMILSEIEEQDHGGKFFSCADLEGHIWNFGSYDPFAKR
jgi:uncharacterized glyoxalase superfamily protein PhnB